MSRFRRLLTVGLVAVTLIGLDVGLTVAQDQNYEGEHFCRWAPAWPNGTYLGQMHPYHSSFYTGYAERRGWDPCITWANDQRNSAVRGLRELGYTVIAPRPVPVPTATPAPVPVAAPRIDPDLQPAWDLYISIVTAWNEGLSPENQRLGQLFVSGARAQTVRIVWANLPDLVSGRYSRAVHTIEIDESLLFERRSAVTAVLAHEMVHAVAEPAKNLEECFGWERIAFTLQAVVWWDTDYPSTDTDLERWLTRLVDVIDTDEFTTWLNDAYSHQCDAWQASQSMPLGPPASR